MPSSGPRSQCAFGSKSNTRGSPWRRTSRLSAALLPIGTVACGRFGSVSSSDFALVFDRVELDAELLDLLGAGAVRLLDRRRVLTLALRAGDLVARRVLLALQPFELGNDAAARRFERGDLFERLVGVEAAAAQAGAHRLEVIANVRRVEHVTSGLHSTFACWRPRLATDATIPA